VSIIYIAGQMTGLPDFNYPAFNDAALRLRECGWEVLNPVDNDTLGGGQSQSWEWYLRRAIRQVTQSDAIALLPGWENSKGATLEHHVGSALGLDIRPLAEWLP
jgi:hypothetical protein